MARGYPDWFGQSIWPKYGTPVYTERSSTVVHAGDNLDIFDVSAQGVLFSAYVRIDCDAAMGTTDLILYVDEVLMDICYLAFRPDVSIIGGARPLIGVSYLNRLTFRADAYLGREVPFKTRFRLNTTNGCGADMTALGWCAHYVVT